MVHSNSTVLSPEEKREILRSQWTGQTSARFKFWLKWIRLQRRPSPHHGWGGARGHPTLATMSRHPKRLGLVGGLTYQDASCECISSWCLLRCLWTTASLAKGLWCDGAHEKQDLTDRFDCTQCSIGINSRLAQMLSGFPNTGMLWSNFHQQLHL